MTKYTAQNLGEIAAAFDTYASDQLAFRRLHRTARDKRDCEIRADVWQEAANMLRSTTLVEIDLLKEEVSKVALDALAADGQAHESYSKTIALHERLTAILDWCDLTADQPGAFNAQGVKLLQGPVFDEARKVIADIFPAGGKTTPAPTKTGACS